VGFEVDANFSKKLRNLLKSIGFMSNALHQRERERERERGNQISREKWEREEEGGGSFRSKFGFCRT
jgi:hypothetical protein